MEFRSNASNGPSSDSLINMTLCLFLNKMLLRTDLKNFYLYKYLANRKLMEKILSIKCDNYKNWFLKDKLFDGKGKKNLT